MYIDRRYLNYKMFNIIILSEDGILSKISKRPDTFVR